jgi:predicted CoA-substrate-specific enzyme activase
MENGPFALGLDVGSVSVDLAVLDAKGEVLESKYVRHRGHPNRAAAEAIREVLERYPAGEIGLVAATGTAGDAVAHHLNGVMVNEVIAQAVATGRLCPDVRTVIDIGGEDSKLVVLRRDEATGRAGVADFAMNTMCAAGTGSFLDQQASRLGLSIEEFGKLALESEHPPRVAGRCSVFAKSDMIHLQQRATPTKDIVAGLCFALVRNFRSTVGSAAELKPPVSFQGGVAANPGIVRAMQRVLELKEDELIIPEHFYAMGAIGAALYARETDQQPTPKLSPEAIDTLGAFEAATSRVTLPPLETAKSTIGVGEVHRPDPPADGSRIPAYLGVDVGSISTNVVVTDAEGRVLSKRYLMTAGQPIEAVRTGLREVGEEVADLVEIRGACTTGSGRYLIADFIGADVVRNEITAQARGATFIDPEVDTIFEIGGQDSKYIQLEHGAVVDFEMNKVCAAGTGSFLEEQAERLGISIKGEFGELALSAKSPLNLGERCTVFMETELLRHQQAGANTADLASGLAYSIVYNYLNRVVAPKPIGKRIFFQGGTAFNRAVVAAFEQVTGQPITVPPHHEVTGALGCALIAREHDIGEGSTFKGFDLADRTYEVTSFECKRCPNRCEINRVVVEGEEPLFYGDRCERFQTRKSALAEGIPDLMAEREHALTHSYEPAGPPPPGAPKVGVPRALIYHEIWPLWHAFLSELGFEIVLSDPTNKEIIHEGAEASVAETCFPMKVALGHLLNLLKKDIRYVWMPSVINLPKDDPRLTDSFVCPYVQSFAYTAKSAVDFAAHGVEPLTPVVYLGVDPTRGDNSLLHLGQRFGKSAREVRAAIRKGLEAQARFSRTMEERGKEVLASLPEGARAIVIVSRSYNGCDEGANLQIPKKLRNMGVWAIPADMLPLDRYKLPEEYANMYWHYGRKILQAAECIINDGRLHSLYLTNFGCGPDSFLNKFYKERLGRRPCLTIEVDEHSADAGMITRCEAFLDSLAAAEKRQFGQPRIPTVNWDLKGRTILIPNMSGHAYALAAAFEACGQSAEVLPEPEDETLYWGRQFTSGKECFPCAVTTGDMVKIVKRPDFDRNKVAFFMGGSGGPCRFGQYNTLQRMVLDELGYEDVPIFAPNQAAGFYNDIGLVGQKLLRIGWVGVVAADIIEKAWRELKPYEVEPGSARQAYWESLQDICEVLKRDGDPLPAMRRARERFDRVKIDRSEPKPIIGLVGEFYIRANAFSNQTLIEKLEDLGAEVWAAPVYEWFLYRNFRRSMRARLDRSWGLLVKNELKDRVMKRDEHRLLEPFIGLLRNAHELPTTEVLGYAADYVHHSFEGEAIMTVGKAIDFARKGLAGVVAVMPFTCMPGTISNAIMKRVRQDEDGVPFLNMVYDGLEQATAATRLEAFVHQARDYMERKKGSGVAAGH